MDVTYCSSCNAKYNVGSLKPGQRFKCKSCGEVVEVPEDEAPEAAEAIDDEPEQDEQESGGRGAKRTAAAAAGGARRGGGPKQDAGVNPALAYGSLAAAAAMLIFTLMGVMGRAKTGGLDNTISGVSASAKELSSAISETRQKAEDAIVKEVPARQKFVEAQDKATLLSSVDANMDPVAEAVSQYFRQRASSGSNSEAFPELVKAVAKKSFPGVVMVMTPESSTSGGGTGSGHIFDREGHVLTNYHVVETAKLVNVRCYGGAEYSATVVNADPETDLAVLQINDIGMKELRAKYPNEEYVLKFADSDSLRRGDLVFAMGAPLGLYDCITAGHVSSPARYMIKGKRLRLDPYKIDTGRYVNYIQHDASINPGNSGGPLVNAEGRVVGTNDWIYNDANNMGFSIPASYARQVAENMIACAKDRKYKLPVRRTWTGIEFAARLSPEGKSHMVVIDVFPYSPADAAGLKVDDVVIEFNGEPVVCKVNEDLPRYQRMMGDATPGDVFRLKVKRGSSPMDIAVTCAEKHPMDQYVYTFNLWGLKVINNSPTVAKNAGVTNTTGVYVHSNTAPRMFYNLFVGLIEDWRDGAEKRNPVINEGDVITEVKVDGRGITINSAADLFHAYNSYAYDEGKVIYCTIVTRTGQTREVQFAGFSSAELSR